MNALSITHLPHMEKATTTLPPKLRVVEVPLLLESGLMEALESAAHAHGTTPAALLRRLIRDSLAMAQGDQPAS